MVSGLPIRVRGSFLRIRLFVGQLNVKFTQDELFSERSGLVPVWRALGISFVWRRYERRPPPVEYEWPHGRHCTIPGCPHCGGPMPREER